MCVRSEVSVGLGKLLEVGVQHAPGEGVAADCREETTTGPEQPPQGAITRNPRMIVGVAEPKANLEETRVRTSHRTHDYHVFTKRRGSRGAAERSDSREDANALRRGLHRCRGGNLCACGHT